MAPAVSTLSEPVRRAYEDVLKSEFNLLTCTAEQLSRFKFVCSKFDMDDSGEPCKIPNGTVRGVYRTTSGNRLVISIIGVVDVKSSRIWAYGNLDKKFDPTSKKLRDCKFIVALKYPAFGPDHPDVDYANGVINEMARVADMQRMVNGLVETPGRITNAARFTKTNGEVSGFMAATLGKVFLPMVSETSAEEFLSQSPTKAGNKKDDGPPAIVDDPRGWIKNTPGGKDLKHNDELPIFFEDGTRVGRTGAELTRELTDGRWVRADCEFVMWSMNDDSGTSRTFQLAVQKMVVLPREPGTEPPTGTEGIEGPGMSYAPMNASDYKPMERGNVEDGKEDGKDDSEGSVKTLSSNKSDHEKRGREDGKEDGSDKPHGKKARV